MVGPMVEMLVYLSAVSRAVLLVEYWVGYLDCSLVDVMVMMLVGSMADLSADCKDDSMAASLVG